ncbi:hypothetical protein E0Z10_g10140 [Xylaria hypoxylon]|uniref:Uncharacterized protein n=1 Tax=Xylaria hypoxylon TaxID=37992 RepID=A0A4Z0Y4D7_9PEZI|nr:hypothetical protein E0Z10_g10140 [Xylaria hypoxylon]
MMAKLLLQFLTLKYEDKILEYTTLVNTIYNYGVPFQLLVQKRWPGASFTIFDVHQVILDIIKTPDDYLDAPANVTGYYTECNPLAPCLGNDSSILPIVICAITVLLYYSLMPP